MGAAPRLEILERILIRVFSSLPETVANLFPGTVLFLSFVLLAVARKQPTLSASCGSQAFDTEALS